MQQTSIPYFFFRGGSSRGPFFNRADLPADLDTLTQVLTSTIGSGHPLNIDGIGGGNAVTTKVAMLSRSNHEWADIDYFFAQISVLDQLVDYKPTCGNMMTAVGPAAIEMGLIGASGDITEVKIRALNTGARVRARVQTPNGLVSYDGEEEIDGVPGTAAPIELNFIDVAGSSTGKFLPTGNCRDRIDGIEVTCMDVAMPMVIATASSLGLSGHETREELDENRALFARIEAIRLKAGLLMGLGDCCKSVIPKFGIVAPAGSGGTLCTRYFMPWTTHPTLAVTGSQCLSACALTPGTVTDGLLTRPTQTPAIVSLEHPMGLMDVIVDFDLTDSQFTHKSAGVVRTARKLASGELFIPGSVWAGPN
ncbi:isomerase [Chromatiales bacterium (ex Bugula neritina AB1)]|nr:isomerase [Chromatiales bacterium (ex Bugula neritina AB1)]